MENIVPVKFARFLYTFALCAENCNKISKCDYTFSRTKFPNFTGYYFPHFTIFCNQTSSFTKFRMLFSAVLMNIPNSKVCLKGESSIVHHLCIYKEGGKGGGGGWITFHKRKNSHFTFHISQVKN